MSDAERKNGILNRKEVEENLPSSVRDRFYWYDSIDSTHRRAKELLTEGAPDGTVVLAESQTAGRGRLGRQFHSPFGGGIYCSVILRPTLKREDMVQMTTAASVAVARAIQRVVGVYPQIKWVNDLYHRGKKICGILAEAVFDPRTAKTAVVLGVGVNCFSTFPQELEEIAGNLMEEDHAGKLGSRLAAEVIKELLSMDALIEKGYIEEYKQHSMVLGEVVTIPAEGKETYLVKEIGECGQLILEDRRGNARILTSGEISIRLWK